MLNNLNYSEINNQPFMKNKVLSETKIKKTLKRNLFIYQFLGTIQSKVQRKNANYEKPFYQLNLICQNDPTIDKIFAFKSKLTNLLIWNDLESNSYLGKTYLLHCRNYKGSYYLVDWEEAKNE